jgi:hypothetical protein
VVLEAGKKCEEGPKTGEFRAFLQRISGVFTNVESEIRDQGSREQGNEEQGNKGLRD